MRVKAWNEKARSVKKEKFFHRSVRFAQTVGLCRMSSFESTQLDSIQFIPIRFNSIQFNSVYFHLSSAQLISTRTKFSFLRSKPRSNSALSLSNHTVEPVRFGLVWFDSIRTFAHSFVRSLSPSAILRN